MSNGSHEPTILYNHTKYLSNILIELCFRDGEVLHIDKQVCGNGGSTAFFKMTPKECYKNILIAPNKQFLIDKKKQYEAEFDRKEVLLKNNLLTSLKVGFFFQESDDRSFDEFDILVFVADSFLLMADRLKDIKIDKVLLDEWHSTEYDSVGLRKNSIGDFLYRVKETITTPNVSISTITASPNKYSPIDVVIRNDFAQPLKIYHQQNRLYTIKNIRKDIKEGHNVLVFTNNMNTVGAIIYDKNLKRSKNQRSYNFVTGISAMRTLARISPINQDDKSNVTFATKKGFEGWDCDYEDARVYIIEDRSKDFETFTIQSVYQAMCRTRKGAFRIEYCRQEKSEVSSKLIDEVDVDNFINSDKYSVHQKQAVDANKIFNYRPFLIFSKDEFGTFNVKKDLTAINIHNEKVVLDSNFSDVLSRGIYKDFFRDRKMSFEDLGSNQKRISSRRNKDKEKQMRLYNSNRIQELDLYGDDYIMEVKSFRARKKGAKADEGCQEKSLDHLLRFIADKNYNGLYKATERQELAINILSDSKTFNVVLKDVRKAYKTHAIKKYSGKKIAKKIVLFEKDLVDFVCQWILTLSRDRILVAPKWIADRNYNLACRKGLAVLNVLADKFGLTITEIDINNCYPRLLYALNKLVLPQNFYGVDKVNKKIISIALNSFMYKKEYRTPLKIQKNQSKIRLVKLGFDEVVIKFLMDKFFLTPFKGDVFNYFAHFERDLIDQLIELVDMDKNEGCVRRHDSLILFNNEQEFDSLEDIEYLGFTGWFGEGIAEEYEVMLLRRRQDYKVSA